MNVGNELLDYISEYNGERKWTHIVPHHSLTYDKMLLNDWKWIKYYHTKILGWDDVGYHAGIEFIDGKLVYHKGRSLDTDGAHCLGMNEKAIGICLIGNFDLFEPSHQQYFALASLTRSYQNKFNIPLLNVQPHWFHKDKSCCGKRFNFIKFREYIKYNISKES